MSRGGWIRGYRQTRPRYVLYVPCRGRPPPIRMSLFWAMYSVSVAQTRQIHTTIVDLHLKRDMAYILPPIRQQRSIKFRRDSESSPSSESIPDSSNSSSRPHELEGCTTVRPTRERPNNDQRCQAVQCKSKAEHSGRCEARRCDVRCAMSSGLA